MKVAILMYIHLKFEIIDTHFSYLIYMDPCIWLENPLTLILRNREQIPFCLDVEMVMASC